MSNGNEIKSVPSALMDALSKSDGLLDKRQKLQKELKASVALRTLVPDAFEGGSATVKWVTIYPHRYPEGFKMIVTKGNGEIVNIKLSETDASDDVLDALKPSWQRKNENE
mgnify:CR=1 FL=1|tara:strand:+ start:585 stop:917 length:333 start_codon:yes stop_codon:yes gene_type:complete